jgi:caffeoyl-CoA O-methyltransferase
VTGPRDDTAADPDVAAYAARHTSPASAALRGVAASTIAWSASHAMMVDEAEGRLLGLLVAVTGARRVLEVGTFSGYSALAMAAALPEDGHIDTLEVDPAHAAKAGEHIRAAGEEMRITVHLGPALDSLRALSGPYDLAFIDADKSEYPVYYELIVPLMRADGLIVADNVLAHGRVLDPARDDALTTGIRRFNERAASDERVETVLLTVRDGVSLIRVRG